MREDCIYKSVCTTECKGVCIRYSEMKYLLDASGIPKNKQQVMQLFPEDCDYDAFCLLNDFKNSIVDNVASGTNLYLVSTHTGNGKTTWAIKILLKYFDEIWAGNGFRTRGLFIHTPAFLLKCKDFDNHGEDFEELKRNILEADLVIWDDIASTGMSQYDLSQLLMYIDSRVISAKSNIYTGNLLFNDLEKTLGSRLASRVWNASMIVEFKGKDRR